MLNKLVYILFIAILIPASIDQSTAERVANNLIIERSTQSDIFLLSHQIIEDGGNVLFYIFSLEPIGFIIVSADDRAVPILGYSFENNFILGIDRNTNVSHLLNTFKTEITNVIINNGPANNEILQKWDKYLSIDINPLQSRSVTPLLTARFDQGATWNDECPEDQAGPGGHALVGCVAVSMAQVMYYWEYPTVGTGSEGYNSPYGYLSANFGNTTYNYADMEPNSGNYHSQILSYHCGVAVNMNYGPDGSGAYVMGGGNSARNAMRNYFGFKNNIGQAYPENYSTTAYRELLQGDLDVNQPIIYRACSTDGCHAWNLDGYEDEEFHCNWGWGGYNNGYFPLSTLGGFSYDQGVLYNIEPEDLDVPHIVLNEIMTTELSGDLDNIINPGETIELVVNLENYIPWTDATNLDIILESTNNDIEVSQDAFFLSYLDAGDSYVNNNNPFVLNINNDIDLGIYSLTLNIIGSNYYVAHDFDIEVSLKQSGYPVANSQTVESSPIALDRNNDGILELFFGDYGGTIHGIDNQGESISGFPIEIEGTNSDIWASPASDDIDNDGEQEIIINSKNGHVYIIDLFGNIELDLDLEQFLMGSPALGDIDGDGVNEIVVASYSSSGKVFAINSDGTFVDGFPVEINEKVRRGVALYDFDNNGKSDIVVATETNNNIITITDSGNSEIIFSANDEFRSAPVLTLINNSLVVFIGSDDGHFYGINSEGGLVLDIDTGSNIRTSAGLVESDNGLCIFFGTSDGLFYGIDSNGDNLDGWPISLGGNISTSPIASDLDGDNVPEILVGTSDLFFAFHLDGSMVSYFPIDSDVGISGNSIATDIDNDNDVDVFFGANTNLYGLDYKVSSNASSAWSMHRGNNFRDGFFNRDASGLMSGDINYDSIVDILDIVILVNLVLSQNATDEQMSVADMNNDGALSILDIVLIINIALDLA